MDMLKRTIAPVTAQAWEEIDAQAKRTLNATLSARKVIDVTEPKGIDTGAVSLGRLDVASAQKSPVKYGIHQVLPLVEARIPFTLNIWELDNAIRGAEDIDFSPLEEAAQQIARFEENIIYYGFAKANINGLMKSSDNPTLKHPASGDALLGVISDGINQFTEKAIEGPYSLVVNPQTWKIIQTQTKGYPLKKQIESLIGGSIVLSNNIKESLLISERGGDTKLTLGQDYAIGYETHDPQKVRLFITASFTFQVIDPAAFMVIA